MSKKLPLKRQSQFLKLLAEGLFESANAQVPGWDELFFDLRYGEDCDLERTIAREGIDRTKISLPVEVSEIGDALAALREEMPMMNYWHGLLMLVDPKGNVEVTYNYDENCVDKFVDDEESHRPF